MKKQFLFVMAFVLTFGLTGQLFAQDDMNARKSKTKSNLSNDRAGVTNPEVCKVKIRSTTSGCEIAFTNEVKSPRDAASGMATGKRTHKPIVITHELDKSSPLLMKDASKQAAGKVTVNDLSVMVKSGGKSKRISVVNNEFTLPADGIDDDCDMILSWSWGMSNSGATERCELPLKLTMENGACVAINKKGTGATNR